MALKFKSGKEMYDYICEGNGIVRLLWRNIQDSWLGWL